MKTIADLLDTWDDLANALERPAFDETYDLVLEMVADVMKAAGVRWAWHYGKYYRLTDDDKVEAYGNPVEMGRSINLSACLIPERPSVDSVNAPHP